MPNKYKHNPQQSCDESWRCTKCHYPVDVDGDWGKCSVPDEVDQKSLDKKKVKELDWEKEFEIKYGRNSGRLTFYNEQKYYWNNKFYDEIKDFIQSLLTQQRTELLEEIKDLQTYVLFNDSEKLISLEQVKSLLNKKDD